MSAETLISKAEEYFCNINPLARRISEDVNATKEAYEGLWNTLSPAQKDQAIDETIIQPEVALKYASKKLDPSKDITDRYPKLRIQTGLKYVIDETGSTLRWRDEHSAPFSFMTQSQMNLNLFGESELKTLNHSYISDSTHYTSPMKLSRGDDCLDDNYSSPTSQISFYQTENYSDTIFSTEDSSTHRSSCIESETSDGMFVKLINKASILKMQNSFDDDTECLVPAKGKSSHKAGSSDKSVMNLGHLKPVDTNESTSLLNTPSSYSSFQSSNTTLEPEIPKTGFEFLDNW